MIIRDLALWGALLLTFALVGCADGFALANLLRPSAQQNSAVPNIIVIFVDDLGFNDVSFNGATDIQTPNIDRIAAEGVMFTSGYVAHPTCGPSRAALLTGRYPARYGMEINVAYAPFDRNLGLPVQEKTFAAHLKRAGYRTGIVGKWQLGAAPPFHPLNRGFDYFYGFLAGGHDYFRVDTSRLDNEYLQPIIDNRAAAGLDGYLTDVLTDRAVEFATDGNRDPFFLYLAYNAPHAPLQAPPELILKYEHIPDRSRRAYLAMIDSLDTNIGRVIDALESAGRRDNTLIFFLSDNGGVYPSKTHPDLNWADNSPFRSGKNAFADGGVRVPFAASWPDGLPQGVAYHDPVISMDIAATAMALAGAEQDPARPLDGVNLIPYLRDEISGVPHAALFWRTWSGYPHRIGYAVRAGDAKLIKPFGDGERPALYDISADPAETQNIIDGRPGEAQALAAMWSDWNSQNVANLFPWNSNYLALMDEARYDYTIGFGAKRIDDAPYEISPTDLLPKRPPRCDNGVVVHNPDANPDLVADCQALMRVRDKIGGSEVLRWNYNKSIYEWNGVTVGGAPSRIRQLDLRERDLTGAIPPEIAALDGLTYLNLRENDLTGAIPPELGGLFRLSELWLQDNHFTGKLPQALLDIPNLAVLRLAGNPIGGCIPPDLWLIDNQDLSFLNLPDCPTNQ